MQCCICNHEIEKHKDWDEGHNAMPIHDGRCCDWCNATIVIPVRIRRMKAKSKQSGKALISSLLLVLAISGCAVTHFGKMERCTERLSKYDPVEVAAQACRDIYGSTQQLPRHRSQRATRLPLKDKERQETAAAEQPDMP